MTLFVANVHYDADEAEVRALFAAIGPLKRFTLLKTNGRLRGYGFVEYQDELDALRAIDDLHRQPFMRRGLIVQEAQGGPRQR